MATNSYDWSTLPYYGLMPNYGMPGGFDSGAYQDPTTDQTYAQVGLPGFNSGPKPTADYGFQNVFGGHSGLTQNADGTFNALRLVEGGNDPTKYEQTTYKLSDDGKSLVPVNNQWTPITIKDQSAWEGLMSGLKDAAPVFLPALGVGALATNGFGLFGDAAAGSGATGAATGSVGTGEAIGGGLKVLGENSMLPFSVESMTAPALETGLFPQIAPSITSLSTAALPALSTFSGAGATPVVPNPAGTGGSGLLNTLGSAVGSAGSYLLNNPGLLGGLLGALTSKGGSGGGGSRSAAPLPANYRPLTYGTPEGIFGKYEPTANELAAPGAQGIFANYLKRELTRGA